MGIVVTNATQCSDNKKSNNNFVKNIINHCKQDDGRNDPKVYFAQKIFAYHLDFRPIRPSE